MAFTADKARQGSAGGSDYEIENSLRFNDDDSAYLSWTPSSAGNRKTWTWSGWVKRSTSGINQSLFSVNATINATCYIRSDDGIIFYDYTGGVYAYKLTTTQLFRDPSAWYHILLSLDTTNSTSGERARIYVNGSRVTDFTSGAEIYPALDFIGRLNNNEVHHIGTRTDGSYPFDGHLAEVNFIDGQALTPSSFGKEGTYGEWKPVEYTGTYGTNGFYLNFKGGGVMAATGGTVTTDGNYKVHTFTADGTFTPTVMGVVEYLVIAGGGAGHTGGGGAGGFLTGYTQANAQSYSITVGAGGTGLGGDGGNSIFNTITSTGGGGGGMNSNNGANGDGADGGSGGGGGGISTGGGGSGISGQGYDGSAGYSNLTNYTRGGGGGGAGAASAYTGNNANAGHGGSGLASSITGSSVTRAGGGGGGSKASIGGSAGSGGSGGGGAGSATGNGFSGTANTGGGGGGRANNIGSAGDGGSGIVIIRYQFQ
jgi:hypothetical protein